MTSDLRVGGVARVQNLGYFNFFFLNRNNLKEDVFQSSFDFVTLVCHEVKFGLTLFSWSSGFALYLDNTISITYFFQIISKCYQTFAQTYLLAAVTLFHDSEIVALYLDNILVYMGESFQY